MTGVEIQIKCVVKTLRLENKMQVSGSEHFCLLLVNVQLGDFNLYSAAAGFLKQQIQVCNSIKN